MLTDGEVTSMRSTLELSLPGTAVVSTPTWVSNGRGGGTTVYTAAGTVNCRVSPATVSEEMTSGHQLHPDTEVIFTVPQDTAVTVSDQLEYDSDVYAVTSLRAPRTWEISRRLEAKVID